MVFKIHGVKGFSGTQNVLLVLEELKLLGHDVPYEVVTVDMKGGVHKSDEYRRTMQPFSQTPIMIDDTDGFRLFEVRAIARYLATLYDAETLYPRKDVKKAALYEQSQSLEHANFHSLYAAISVETIYKPGYMAKPVDKQRAKDLIEMFERRLDGYDIILSNSRYLAGEEYTLADLMHIPAGHVIEQYLGLDCLRKKKHVSRWWSEISSRPAWEAVKKIAEEDTEGWRLPPKDSLDLSGLTNEKDVANVA